MVEFGIEPLSRAQPEIEALLPAQWAYTGDRDIECKPNWNFYRKVDDHGALMLIVARDFDCAVGYLAAFIYPHVNAVDVKVAEIPTYFVVERPTRALIMSRMGDFAIEQLARRGIYKINVDTNAEHSAGRLWESKGFKLARMGYSIRLEKPAGELDA